ncbi:hypothetical protein ACLB2K_077541 [Fragaria x ananassa]
MKSSDWGEGAPGDRTVEGEEQMGARAPDHRSSPPEEEEECFQKRGMKWVWSRSMHLVCLFYPRYGSQVCLTGSQDHKLTTLLGEGVDRGSPP